MSKSRKRRRVTAWARYFNRYAWIPNVVIGGQGAYDALVASRGWPEQWSALRHQQKHRFCEGYPLP